jgi:hypothetical protein
MPFGKKHRVPKQQPWPTTPDGQNQWEAPPPVQGGIGGAGLAGGLTGAGGLLGPDGHLRPEIAAKLGPDRAAKVEQAVEMAMTSGGAGQVFDLSGADPAVRAERLAALRPRLDAMRASGRMSEAQYQRSIAAIDAQAQGGSPDPSGQGLPYPEPPPPLEGPGPY